MFLRNLNLHSMNEKEIDNKNKFYISIFKRLIKCNKIKTCKISNYVQQFRIKVEKKNALFKKI